jgi:hypothetical protein
MSSESLPPNMKVLEAFSFTEGRLERSESRGGFRKQGRVEGNDVTCGEGREDGK